MSKKKENFLIIFAIIIFLLAGFYYAWQNDLLPKQVCVMGICVNLRVNLRQSALEEEKWRRSQELQIASLIKSGNIRSCDDINYKSADGIDYAKVCANNIALQKAQETLDISWCKKLDGKLIGIENCEREILFSKMSKENNIVVCDTAPNEPLKTECQNGYWSQKAVKDNDIALCKKINDIANRCEENYYIENLVKNPQTADCSKFTNDNQKKDCENFQQAAASKKTSSFSCSRLLNPRLEFACERLR